MGKKMKIDRFSLFLILIFVVWFVSDKQVIAFFQTLFQGGNGNG